MKSIQIILIPIYFILLLTNLHAQRDTYSAPKVGTAINGGVFLHREPVEMYWDDWVAYPMMDRKDLPSDGQAVLAITGEGKSVNFNGILSINCVNGQNYWEAANADAPDEHIPVAVKNNAVSLFCKGGSTKLATMNQSSANTQAQSPSQSQSQSMNIGPLSCNTPVLVNMVTNEYKNNAFDYLLSKRFGMKTTGADFKNIMNNAETLKGRIELETLWNNTVEAYEKLSISLRLIRTVNRDEASGMVECATTVNLGNGKTVEGWYQSQYTDNGELYTVFKPLF